MNADLTALLDAMQARCDAATEGMWVAHCPDPDEVHILAACTADACHDDPWSHPDVVHLAGDEVQEPLSPADAEFIAAARSDLPRLIAAVRAVLDRARMEQDDAESAMTYAAEIDDALMLAHHQGRKQAWADAARALTTALTEADDD